MASDRTIHIVVDGAVICTRPSRLSERDLRDLLGRGARIAGPAPAPGAATVDMLTTSAVIEVARTVSRDGCIGLGGDKVLRGSTLVGQRVTVRFEGTLMHVVANGRLAKTLPAAMPSAQRAALRGARPSAEPLPTPAPPAPGHATSGGQRHGHRGRPTPARRTKLPMTDVRHCHRGHRLSRLHRPQRDLHPRRKTRYRHRHLQGPPPPPSHLNTSKITQAESVKAVLKHNCQACRETAYGQCMGILGSAGADGLRPWLVDWHTTARGDLRVAIRGSTELVG